MKTLIPMLPQAPIAAAALSLVLAGCATAQAPVPAATPAPAASASAPASVVSAPAARPAAPLPGALAPFAEIVREAKRADGYLPVWTRDDRTWLEIPSVLLDKPFFMASSVAGGTGEGRFWPGLTGRGDMVELRRVGNTVQLIARNTTIRAPAGTPLARALSESYSDSLLGAAPLAAAPHPLSKALLVDAAVLLGGDIFNAQLALEAQHRLPYALDRANSSFERVRATAAGTYFTLRQHFSVARLPTTVPNPAQAPNPPRSLPDVRSLFISLTYTLAPLPAEPLKTRAADARVGYFNTSFVDLGDDTQEGRRTHLIRRWRLEKADPAAAVSAPKEPIRVVMDRNIPEKWRTPVREGLLEWNKAFERAGFRNAVVVEQQPADAGWSALEGTRVIAVRWFAQEGPGSTAVGPSQSDPRTGEMLRGAVIIDENRVRLMRARVAETVPVLGQARPADFAARLTFDTTPEESCSYGQDALDDAAFGLELLAARGVIDPNGPEGDRFIADALKNVSMHELGHVLGLRHNFRASASVTLAQLRDPAYTAANGLSPSVMDYNGQNTPLEGEPLADYHMTTLGAYDYWAIEYGYRQWPDATTEKRELAALASRGDREPLLAYGTDEDLANNDPLIHQRDIGDDPLAFAQRQMKLARELWQRTTTRALTPNEDYTLYRRAISRVFGAMATSLPLATKVIGGSYTARVSPAANRPLVQPVPVKDQRAALALVVTEFFGSPAFKFDPQLMMRLGVDQGERAGPNRGGVEYSLQTQALTLQRQALDALMAEALAGRLADAESQVADPRTLLDFAEVQASLSNAVWSELVAKGPVAVDSLRRNLQREHVRRLAAGLVRPATQAAADVRPVFRHTALQLQTRLNAALSGGKATGLVRAHLDDCLATLSEALKAPLVKQGV